MNTLILRKCPLLFTSQHLAKPVDLQYTEFQKLRSFEKTQKQLENIQTKRSRREKKLVKIAKKRERRNETGMSQAANREQNILDWNEYIDYSYPILPGPRDHRGRKPKDAKWSDSAYSVPSRPLDLPTPPDVIPRKPHGWSRKNYLNKPPIMVSKISLPENPAKRTLGYTRIPYVRPGDGPSDGITGLGKKKTPKIEEDTSSPKSD